MRILFPMTVVIGSLGCTPMPSAPGPAEFTITWEPCADMTLSEAECGELVVPVDWAAPDGEQLTLALARRPATDQDDRIGTLLLNNAAGGASIEQLRLALAIELPAFAGALTDRFDLVAVDARGVGQSTPVSCDGDPRPPGVTYFPSTLEEYETLRDHNRAWGASCLANNPGVVSHMDLRNVAHDMEAVRLALGEEVLDWYGIHASTLLGRTYARSYPGRLRTMVLDTALDDTASLLEQVEREARAAERAFDRFVAWCASDERCVLHGEDVAMHYDSLVATANAAPIPAALTGTTLTGEDIQFATQSYLNLADVLWPILAEAIDEARAGDASAFTIEPDGTLDWTQLHVAQCLDAQRPQLTFETMSVIRSAIAELSPHLGGATRSWRALAGCLDWPVPPAPRDPGTPVTDAPTALIVQSTNQALTPLSSAYRLAEQLPNSVVLPREGDDYSMFLVSPCVRDAINRYLVDLELPEPNAVCTD